MATGRLLHSTTSLCRVCKRALPARVVEGPEGGAWMHKECPEHGPQEVRLSADAGWYIQTRAHQPIPAPPPRAARPVALGCPFDCGPCGAHAQKVRLAVVTITSACNLRCPICYVHNKNEGAFHMGTTEFGQVLDRLVEDADGEPELINLTGGDPTLHPELLTLLRMCRERGVRRVSICTNGIRLAQDPGLVEQLASLGARVALSYSTLEAEADRALNGASLLELKERCLDLLEEHEVDTTLIPVMTRGLNDHELGSFLRAAIRRTNVRHLELHTMTYTGQGGVSCDRGGRISMDEVLTLFEEQSGGLLDRRSFVPSPSAHPLCYQIAYLLLDPSGGPPIPFLSFLSKEELYQSLGPSLYLEPSPAMERILRGAIDRLWASDPGSISGAAGPEEQERVLGALKALLRSAFPRRPISREEALRAGERAAKAIYVHSHMDEETFDTERLAQCCDSNCYADGSRVPVCAYNVLYREKEARFMSEPKAWSSRAGGDRSLPVIRG